MVAYRPFHPLDFIVINFMQVNDCEDEQREGATRTVHSRRRTRGDGANDGGEMERMTEVGWGGRRGRAGRMTGAGWGG